MQDIFDHHIICKNCKKETTKTKTLKDGFELRAWECQKCHSLIYHPSDLRDYEEYKKLRRQDFNVKLRMVGNSFCVSIPKEIIDFQNEMLNELNQKIDNEMSEEIDDEISGETDDQQENKPEAEREVLERRLTKLVRLNLEEPGKIGLFFFRTKRHNFK